MSGERHLSSTCTRLYHQGSCMDQLAATFSLSYDTSAAVLPCRAEEEYRALIRLDMPQPKEARSQLLRGTQASYVHTPQGPSHRALISLNLLYVRRVCPPISRRILYVRTLRMTLTVLRCTHRRICSKSRGSTPGTCHHTQWLC
jgi:plasmid stabilization system protein ParE